tara:strand:+ start:204 stop:3074 length:2871 start_codon:yes stop_codon:yes gene_type:complete
MKRIIISLIMLLAPFSSLFSQMNDTTALLQSMATSSQALNQSQRDLDSEDDAKNNDDKDDIGKVKPDINFKDKDYGYTGGKSFVAPPQTRFSDEELSYFGYDFFTDMSTDYVSENTPVPQDYVLGPNDRIKLAIFGSFNQQYKLDITREGEIFLPGIGPVTAAGITFENFKSLIKELVSSNYIGAEVSVTLGSFRSIDIFVLGETLKPGMYSISALSTLVNAITKSGGVASTGSLRNIQLKRQGEVISDFDFYDLLLNGDTSRDVRLMQGDVIFVPPIAKTVGVSGEVARPGIYELNNDESLKDLIDYAGGLKPKADLFSADLMRIDPIINGFNLIQINLNNNFELNNGDVLSIHPIVDNLKNAILITGHAQQPGFFPLIEGMKIGDLIPSADSTLAMTDLNYVLVKRKSKINNSFQFLQVDLESIFRDKESDENIVLQEKDEVLFLPSLLTPNLIKTQLLQDEYYINEAGEMTLVAEWNSLAYLRKSLMEEMNLDIETTGFSSENADKSSAVIQEDKKMKRYYEYSIYDYCSLPEDEAIRIIESSGFRAKKSVPLEDLDNLTTLQDVKSLQQMAEKERSKNEQSDSNVFLSSEITNLCRDQLLNPILEIIDHQNDKNGEKDTISVFGNVFFPGNYPLTVGMELKDAIKAAGGLKNSTYNSEIELSRSDTTGKKISVYNSIASIGDLSSMNLSLKERDVINLKEISNKIKTVKITGEVYFEGEYPISENQTLMEIINRAGGLTDYASVDAARLQREALKEAEMTRLTNARSELKRKIVLSSQSGGLGQDSLDGNAISQLTALLVDDSVNDSALGRLVIDLGAILKGDDVDIRLEDGDTLHIPKLQQTISVIGEVYVPNSHVFKPNLRINDYINFSGGANTFADSDNVYIVKADGSILSPNQLSNSGFFKNKMSILEEGDTIVVPLEVQPFSAIRATTEVTQIIYQMALAAAAVNSF